MVWLAVTAVLLLLVYSAGFRKFALGLLAVLVVIVVVAILYEENKQSRALTLISPQEVQLDNLRLSSEGSYRRQLTGRIKNNSLRYTLRSVDVKITLRDCEKQESSESTCTIVGETTEHLYVTIPPNQARDITNHVSGLSSVSPKGKIVLNYTISEVVGQEPS